MSQSDSEQGLTAIARRALEHYPVGADAQLTLLNISENATYAVDDLATGRRTVLRVHRLGYHSAAAVESELSWLDALRGDVGIQTPHVLPARDGRRVISLSERAAREPRHAVMFEFLDGVEPPEERFTESFSLLGATTARMHEHARSWRRPPHFTRFAWDYDGAFGPQARWGQWSHGIGVGPDEREVLGRLATTLHTRLSHYGTGRERYGLVHADLRLANLLLHDNQVRVIDFDDCGWSWFLYDLGTAVSFIEHDPRVPELVDSWLAGYQSVRPLSDEDEAEIPTFILMRRLLEVAWIGSHPGTELARSMGEEYTQQSCELAETYLGRFA